MNRTLLRTADGSATIHIEEMNVTYHSRHGAVQESMHVFINAGLVYYCNARPEKKELNIFEMGMGTGLNVLLTADHAVEHDLNIYYETLELHPLSNEETALLDYGTYVKTDIHTIHNATWNSPVKLIERFTLKKVKQSLIEYRTPELFDIIYFDAFAPTAQPELWTEDIFHKMYGKLTQGGVLVTYCSKGDVRRAMIAAGFTVDKIQGPPGKREMLRATKQ
ncbi:MAG: tRNA (5-methylaminomethyl-2-thiouridine)(34)-methyltransferase MnmD [Chitinophagaceae bacterium]|nr:tRNA (5-methylaminomethyl-2-thiouridine)(34)-methyltransferase MnmD [Chitinophagaceae bacterium]